MGGRHDVQELVRRNVSSSRGDALQVFDLLVPMPALTVRVEQCLTRVPAGLDAKWSDPKFRRGLGVLNPTHGAVDGGLLDRR